MTVHEGRPEWLDRALAQHPPGDVFAKVETPGEIAPVEYGDIRATRPMDAGGDLRLSLVVDVDDEHCTVAVSLLSNLVDNATDVDVVLAAALTGLSFDLIAEADVVGTIWQWQLSSSVAQIPLPMVDAIEKLPRSTNREALSLLRGMPLSGTGDVRWTWKEDEVIELQRLTADCLRTLLEAPTIDVGFLAAEGVHQEALQEMALASSDLAMAGSAVMPSTTAEALGLEDVTVSDRLVERLGVDAWLAIHELLISSVGDEEPTAISSAGPLPHRRIDAQRDPLLRVVDDSVSTVRIITWIDLWDDSVRGPVEVDIGGRTKHVVRELLTVMES
jgi:hypothetical protein